MEIFYSNTIAEVEAFCATLPAETIIIIDGTLSGYVVYDEGELTGDCLNILHTGRAGDFHVLPQMF